MSALARENGWRGFEGIGERVDGGYEYRCDGMPSYFGCPESVVVTRRFARVGVKKTGWLVCFGIEDNDTPDTDVVLCVSDLSAFGALMECQRRGMKVPGDIAIAGFGDYEISASCYPRITTVNVDCYGIGRLAAERVLSALQAGPGGGADELILTPYRVVLRESA